MQIISIILVIFSAIAAVDYIIGNRFGLGHEFERGFKLLGNMSLAMIGMIVIAPLLADVLSPCFETVYAVFGLEPSVIPASLLANDMGGAPLSLEVAKDGNLGLFNALVVSSMMGCTISFTIPVALQMVPENCHKELILGFLCGIVTIPFGCMFAGIAAGISLPMLLGDLLPLVLFSGIIVCGLLFAQRLCVRIFSILGVIIKAIIICGLVMGILRYLLHIEPIKGLETVESGALVCFNAAIVMSGAFPMIHILSKLLKKPLQRIGERIGINETAAMGFIATLATTLSTFEMMEKMDQKGVMLNAAFLVSAGFTFAGHLAFTMAFDASYIPYVILAKLSAGVLAFLFAVLLNRRTEKKNAEAASSSQYAP